MYWDSCSTAGWFASGGKSYMVLSVELFHLPSCQFSAVISWGYFPQSMYISDANDYIQCENFRSESTLLLASHEKESWGLSFMNEKLVKNQKENFILEDNYAE